MTNDSPQIQVREVFVELYEKLLSEPELKRALRPLQPYCGFAARCGSAWSLGGLMFYGRAINGRWADSDTFMLKDLASEESIRRKAEAIVDSAHLPICKPEGASGKPEGPYGFCRDEGCDGDPLHWVKHLRKYVNERRSAYWRSIKQITETHLGLTEEQKGFWYRYIACSNLYKLGPDQAPGATAPTGNPGARLKEAQRMTCVEILEAEILRFRPRWVVLLTEINHFSGYFDDFRKLLNVKTFNTESDLKYVREVGTLRIQDHECRIVLAQHPQGRGRSPAKVAQDVLRALSDTA